MNLRVLIAATILIGAGGVSAAPATMKAAAPKGVKCGDSYIATGQVCHKAPAPITKGVKCGDSYIATGQVCHKTAMAAPAKPAMMAPAKPAAMAKTAMAPAKGKKCGNSYIAATATCTKK